MFYLGKKIPKRFFSKNSFQEKKLPTKTEMANIGACLVRGEQEKDPCHALEPACEHLYNIFLGTFANIVPLNVEKCTITISKFLPANHKSAFEKVQKSIRERIHLSVNFQKKYPRNQLNATDHSLTGYFDAQGGKY